MHEINSVSNSLIKNITKLEQKKYREQTGLYLVEGFHLFAEALKTREHIHYILATADAWDKINAHYRLDLPEEKKVLVNKEVARKLSATRNSQEVFLLLQIEQPRNFKIHYGKWVLLDDLADPGNVGTIVRTADAAGFDGVVLSPKTCDIYNSKTQRAMQGSQFHIRLVKMDLKEAIIELHDASIPVYASLLDKKAKKLSEFARQNQLGLIIGNEAHGVNKFISELADDKLYIPIKGKAESLNAAVAAGIMIYHFA